MIPPLPPVAPLPPNAFIALPAPLDTDDFDLVIERMRKSLGELQRALWARRRYGDFLAHEDRARLDLALAINLELIEFGAGYLRKRI